ncbi:MAG: PorT family protein [Prevotella sp.]|nr:PorT family protein [Prevotella sp.]
MKRLFFIFSFFHFFIATTVAQVGEYRTDFAVGVNGGYLMSSVAFVPEVPQKQLGGITGGITMRYTCEKYFNSICAIVAEVNYAQAGWKEDILSVNDEAVPLHTDPSQTLAFERRITYVQVPLLARMGWGRERKGLQFFAQIGPQVGMYMSDKVKSNFDARDPEFNPGTTDQPNPLYRYRGVRASNVVAQDTLPVKYKLDYGIAGGAGIEYSHPRLGHFLLEGRYYFGLGNIFGNSKSDVFGKSNYGQIVIKASWLFDIVRTKNDKIR